MLELDHALGKGLERQVGLGTRGLGEGHLEHQALVRGRAHVVAGIAKKGKHPREPVGGAEGRGLLAQSLQLVARDRHDLLACACHGHHVDVANVGGELTGKLQQVAAGVHERGDLVEERDHVATGHGTRDLAEHEAGRLAQEVLRHLDRDPAHAKGGQLLEGGQGIAHAAAGVADHQVEGPRLVGEALLVAHVGQVVAHLLRRDGVEVEALDAAEDGGEDLLRVGRAHDEGHARRRLLEGLEQAVESGLAQHVDLVDDIDLATASDGGVVDAADDLLAYVVHAGAGGSVELYDVGMLAGGDQAALLAGAVGELAGAGLAHEGLGQQARHGGLAGAARATEEVGVAGAALEDRALEGLDHVALANDLLERLRAVFGVERFHAAPPVPGLWAPSIPGGRRAGGGSMRRGRS